MTTWKSALTLTVAAAMVATTAFAQSSGGGAKTPSASPSPSEKAPSSTPSTSPSTSTDPAAKSDSTKSDTMKSDTMKSDTMKSDKMSSDKMGKGRMRAAGGGNREQVKAVQQALKDKGHDPGAVDGVMGPKTRTALKDFQKKEGIKDTGQMDLETMAKLGVEAKTSSEGSASSGSTASGSPAAGGMSPGSSTSGNGQPEPQRDAGQLGRRQEERHGDDREEVRATVEKR